jgi:hypothetical protein
MGPPAGPVRVSLSLGGGHDENERRSEAGDGGPGAEVHNSAARGGLDRPRAGRFWPGAMRASRPPAPCRARAPPQLAHRLPPRPIGSDAVALAVGGRVRPLSPRHGISSVPREPACLKHACLTAMAARLPAFSGYRRGRPPAASTLARPRAGRTCAASSDHAAGSTRNTSRTRELTLADSAWVGARTSAAKSVQRGQHSVPRCSAAQNHSAQAACQVAPCAGCNGLSCNMQPGTLRRVIRRQRKLQHTHAHAHTECAHTHVCAQTQRHTETDPHAHARGPSLGAVAGRDEPHINVRGLRRGPHADVGRSERDERVRISLQGLGPQV